ncbi:MAG TPA: hypothetical protein PLU58_05440 [Saprospiraceae bacterium]|nr:hypothetical protein [Saprospiraceae bacterium]
MKSIFPILLFCISLNIGQAQNGKLPLTSGTELVVNKKYETPTGGYSLVFQADGNLVVRNNADVFLYGSFQAGEPLNGKKARLETDGSFKVYSSDGQFMWGIPINMPGSKLSINDKGEVVILTPDNKTLWNGSKQNAAQLLPNGTEGRRDDSEIAAGKEINLQVIFVDWADQPATSNDFDGLWNIITDNNKMFEAFQAQGAKVNVQLIKSGWKRMPKNQSYYFPPSTAAQSWNWQEYTQDGLKLIGEGPDFPANTIAILVPSKGINGFKGIVSGAHGAGFRGIRKMITPVPEIYNEHYTTMMHEIGHCFGSGELYPASYPYLHEVGGYDLMGDAVFATGFIGWHRYRYGWLGGDRIQLLNQKGDYQIALNKLSNSAGKAMVVIPDPAKKTKYWVIEIGQDVVSREQFRAGKGEKLNAEGDRLIVYTVEAPEATDKRAIRLVPRTNFEGSQGTVVWLDKVSYKAGQKSERTDMPFTLSVGKKTAEGLTLTVSITQNIGYMGFPEDIPSSNGQYKLSVQNDGNLGIYRSANNSYVWDAKNKLFAGKPLNNTWVSLRYGNIQLVDTNTGLTIDEKVVNAPNGSQLKVSDDGKLLVVDSSGKEIWRNN